jgi:ABC-type branched-subunit amino acid transport system ATPase component
LSKESDILLSVTRLATGYDGRQILSEIDLQVSRGEVVAVIGHNGSGKSTLLKALFGVLPIWSGHVLFHGLESSIEPRALLRHGVAYVPQGHRVFQRLSVRDNLRLASVVLDAAGRRQGVDRAFDLFPILYKRQHQQAATLSGGEKQVLAFACAMCLKPHMLLLDEPSLGLSPALVEDAMRRIVEAAHDSGIGCLVVEQKVRQVLEIADRVYALRGGKVVFSGVAEELSDDDKLREVYL